MNWTGDIDGVKGIGADLIRAVEVVLLLRSAIDNSGVSNNYKSRISQIDSEQCIRLDGNDTGSAGANCGVVILCGSEGINNGVRAMSIDIIGGKPCKFLRIQACIDSNTRPSPYAIKDA